MSIHTLPQECWTVPEAELHELSPAHARDLIVECFFQAQHETFLRAKQRVSSRPAAPDAIHAAVVAAVRVAFKESGGDYDHPSSASLARMVDVLARKAQSWGTPDDVVTHHRGQIGRVLGALSLQHAP